MAGMVLEHGSWSSPEDEKIRQLARMLSGYDEVTWNELRRDRKLTYVRAASNLFHNWEEFAKLLITPPAKL
jgi:hypothetical protein